MKNYRYGVYTIEREVSTHEEYNTESGRFEKIRQTIKTPRMTYCGSREEAKEFLREIGTRGYPNIIYSSYRGLMQYNG